MPLAMPMSTPKSVATDSLQTDSVGDSVRNEAVRLSYRQLIIPSVLIAYGVVETALAGKVRLLNYAIGHELNAHVQGRFRIDDITQYVPMASVYALNAWGVKGKHGFKERTWMLGISSLLMGISVNTVKYTVRAERPDKSGRNSFPSGHTAMAFMGAEFLWQEYKDVSVWYGIAGYSLAISTGLFRMYNKKHWLGDVVAGGGIGILSTKAAYWIYPVLKRKVTKKKSKNDTDIAFAPFYDGKQGGMSLFIQL